MKRVIAWSFVLVGAFFGVVWYFDVNQAGESWGDVFSDPWSSLQDLFQRGVAVAQSSISSDPVVIATGLVAGFEGFVGHSYQDQAGIWTIGYGHKIVAGDGFESDPSQLISQPDAFALLQADLATAVNCVNNSVTADLSPQQLAALYSFTFNVGCGAFESSTLLKDINDGNLDDAATEFGKWIHAGGSVVGDLVSRRQSEADLFSSASTSADQTQVASTDSDTSSDDSAV